MLYTIANNVNDSTIKTITELEKEIGTTLLAFQDVSLSPTELNESQLEKVQKVEKQLGVSLIAVAN